MRKQYGLQLCKQSFVQAASSQSLPCCMPPFDRQSANMYNAALLLVTLSLLCASAAAQPKGTVLASSGASSLTVLPSSNGNIVLKAVLGPCTGAQIHTHNRTEYATAAKSKQTANCSYMPAIHRRRVPLNYVWCHWHGWSARMWAR